MKSSSSSRKLILKSLFPIGLVLLCITLLSCESHEEVHMVIIDKSTNLPIDSVYVNIGAGLDGDFTKSGIEGYTDSTGQFFGNFMAGFKYKTKMTCSKEGYEIFTLSNEYRDTVYLIPLD